MIKRGNIVSVIGGSGFLGKAVIKHLAKLGVTVKVACRNPNRAAELKICGAVGQIALIKCDIRNEQELESIIAGSDAVINLVGLLFSKGEQNFHNCHLKGAVNVANLCNKHKVKSLVHISALGVDKASGSSYAATKFAAEKEIQKIFPSSIIIRPSVIFGPDDNFINMFAMITKLSPVFPLIGGGKTKFQPVYVEDVAKLVIVAMNEKSAEGKILEVGGPKVYTMKEIIEFILKTTKRKRLLFALPDTIASIQAFVFERFPKPPLTRDQLKLLKYDNVVTTKNALVEYELPLTSMESVVPNYIVS